MASASGDRRVSVFIVRIVLVHSGLCKWCAVCSRGRNTSDHRDRRSRPVACRRGPTEPTCPGDGRPDSRAWCNPRHRRRPRDRRPSRNVSRSSWGTRSGHDPTSHPMSIGDSRSLLRWKTTRSSTGPGTSGRRPESVVETAAPAATRRQPRRRRPERARRAAPGRRRRIRQRPAPAPAYPAGVAAGVAGGIGSTSIRVAVAVSTPSIRTAPSRLAPEKA